MTVDKSRNPYYDDFNEQKHFHEVLFVPSRAVQVRELNQIQSMFYEQVSRLGDHVFKDGSIVIPGEVNYDLNLTYITVNLNNIANSNTLLSGTSEVKIVGTNTGIEATKKLYRSPEGNDPATIYFEYGQSSTDLTKTRFATDDNIELYIGDDLIDTGTVIAEGQGSKLTINSGVYYIAGRFVLVERENVILDKYSGTPSKIVCIEYNQNIVTENDDNSLFDNAQGTPNFTAPGAHRLRIDTKLRVFDISELNSLPQNCVEIFRIQDGVVQKRARSPEYNVLNDVLAQRTYEESGNYTVKDFRLSTANYEDAFPNLTPDDSKFAIELSRGIGYVEGFRVEKLANSKVAVDKARDTETINNSSISAALGFYITVDDLSAMPNTNALQNISFYDGAVGTAGTVPAGNVLGTARIRFIRKSGTSFRIYLFNVRDVAGNKDTSFIENAVSIYSTDNVTFTATINDTSGSVLNEPSLSTLVYPLGAETVKTLKDEFGATDTSYTVVQQKTGTLDTNGSITFSSAPNNVFLSQDSTYAFGYFTDNDAYFDFTGTNEVTLGGSPNGSTITLSFGVSEAGRPIRVNLQTAKQQIQEKTKTLATATKGGSLDVDGRLYLDKADVYRIDSVIDNEGTDVTNLFSFEINKTKSYYDVSYLVNSQIGNYVEPLTVSFAYFSHSSGDYFSIDSYVDLDYSEVPVEDGVRLSDVMDFRPRIGDNGSDFISAGSSVSEFPIPYTVIRTDLEHYLPRIDLVVIKTSGQFEIVRGLPSVNPKAPKEPSGTMTLHTLSIPSYTFDVENVDSFKKKNQRYTMNDIGRLDQRLSNVEYYVSLNNLEQDAESKQIIDPSTGIERFKNGFTTDSFTDHSVADFGWQGYRVSMADEGILRPEFSINAVDLELNALASSNYAINDGVVTLPFVETSFLRQNQRSETLNVNPYAVFRWDGTIKLDPEIDSWIDTDYVAPRNVSRTVNGGNLSQNFNSWNTNWAGTEEENESETFTVERRGGGGAWIDPWRWQTGGRVEVTLERTSSVRTNTSVVGDRLIDTSVIPFMRSINIQIEGTGNRPKTKLNFYFDDSDVTQFVGPTSSTIGQDVVTTEDGDFDAVFRIPNNGTFRFPTGERTVSATDSPDAGRENSTTYADAVFASSGVRQTRQRTIRTTRQIVSSTREIGREVISEGRIIDTRTEWFDPLAQSFLVEREGGVFTTSVDVFFAEKDETVPITVEIREMENGYPTQRVITGASKTLKPSQVNLSADGSVATNFKFPYPVHLTSGVEYCFVIWSNSNNYEAWIARMGDQDIGTNKFIVEQPYAGVLFKSQNNSTWSEDQTADLQFELYIAEFDTNVVGQIEMTNKEFDTYRFVNSNPIETTSGSSDIIINKNQHNYVVGSVIELSGMTGGNNIPATEINGQHTVTEVIDPNTFKVSVTSVANQSGNVGGVDGEITRTYQASLLSPNIPNLTFPETTLSYFARGTNGQSFDGLEVPYQSQNSFIEIENNENNALRNPWIITNSADETANLAGQKSLYCRAVLTSTNKNISPVVDLQGANIVTPFAMITNEGVEADGSDNWANYRTQINRLRFGAESLKVFVDVAKPESSNVEISARFGNSDEEVREAQWMNLSQVTTDEIVISSDDYIENEYEIDPTGTYTQYQLMIRLKSPSCANYPSCKRLRSIAVA